MVDATGGKVGVIEVCVIEIVEGGGGVVATVWIGGCREGEGGHDGQENELELHVVWLV
jgi:hypothetical protein